MKVIENIAYDTICSEQTLTLYLPEESHFPIFVYFHGGSLFEGNKDRDRKIFEYLAERGVAVASADYRMYPKAKFPEFIEDAASAVAWVMKNISHYGKVEDVFVGGSSAGGYLSQMLCFAKKYLDIHGIKPFDITGWVFDAGQPTSHFSVLRERSIDPRRIIVDETAPLYFVNNNDYSPMLVFVSDNDLKCRLEQTYLLKSVLEHFEYDMSKFHFTVKRGVHVAYVYEFDKDTNPSYADDIIKFIKKYKRG